jgi:hypothetical protein
MKPNSPTPPEGYRIVEPEEGSEPLPGLKFREKDGQSTAPWKAWRGGNIREYDRLVFHFAAPSHPAPPEGKRAPVQGFPGGIPWEMHLRAYAVYSERCGPQPAMIEGGCQGGFHTSELDLFIPGWREELAAPAPSEAGQEPVRELFDALGKWFAERERKGYTVRDEGEVAAFKAFKKCQELSAPRPAAQPTPKGTVERLKSRAKGIREDVLANHLPRVMEGMKAGYVDENQLMVCLDHAMRARIMEELAAEPAALARLESEGE